MKGERKRKGQKPKAKSQKPKEEIIVKLDQLSLFFLLFLYLFLSPWLRASVLKLLTVSAQHARASAPKKQKPNRPTQPRG